MSPSLLCLVETFAGVHVFEAHPGVAVLDVGHLLYDLLLGVTALLEVPQFDFSVSVEDKRGEHLTGIDLCEVRLSNYSIIAAESLHDRLCLGCSRQTPGRFQAPSSRASESILNLSLVFPIGVLFELKWASNAF